MSDETQKDIFIDLSSPIRSTLVVTGGVKFLIQDFMDKNGTVYSIACPNVMVKMHKKEESDGKSRDNSSGSSEEVVEGEECKDEEGSSPNNESKVEKA
jgi:hypothetical protein